MMDGQFEMNDQTYYKHCTCIFTTLDENDRLAFNILKLPSYEEGVFERAYEADFDRPLF